MLDCLYPTYARKDLRGSPAMPLCSALLIAHSQREWAGGNGRALRTCLQGSTRGIGLSGALSDHMVHYAAAPTAVTSPQPVPRLTPASRTTLAGMDPMDRMDLMDGAKEDVVEHGCRLLPAILRLNLVYPLLKFAAHYVLGTQADGQCHTQADGPQDHQESIGDEFCFDAQLLEGGEDHEND
jgi:hypothetical protein